ncbi:uncharacterized protein BBA_07884 [Beauveria bassiana ARSEF 2860]|uniref:Uncharacterized protein n=1 Tax=Beauveria bassiana (strain ARSEF 2860) TaxID=655819 RepID=J4KLZ8_BEAB2|nr:uncharacterized protein BBA_07884 [Beauveria bassiana ARSEF 2860]EJP63079.1 hypothetical protein BBA_07884 [Beauveria bassiana ARSEF 2860]
MADYVGAVDGEIAYAFQPWIDDIGASLARVATTKPNELYALAVAFATIAGAKRSVNKRSFKNKRQVHEPNSERHKDEDGDHIMWMVRWTDGAGSPCLVHYRRVWRCRWGTEKLGAFDWAFPSVFVYNDICDVFADVQVGEAMNSVLWTASARNKGATGALSRVYGDYVMATTVPDNDEQFASCVRMYCAGTIMYEALPRYSGAADKTRVADCKAATDLVVTVYGTEGMVRSWKGDPVKEVTWAEFTTMGEQIRQRLRPYVKEDTARYIEGLLSVLRLAYNGMDDAAVQRAMFELYTSGCTYLDVADEEENSGLSQPVPGLSDNDIPLHYEQLVLEAAHTRYHKLPLSKHQHQGVTA